MSEARSKALALTLEVQGGSDPLSRASPAEQAGETFAKLAQRYLAEHERRNARGRQAQPIDGPGRAAVAGGHPSGDRVRHRAEAVTQTAECSGAVEAAADRGAFVVADRILGLIRAIYNWGMATGALEVEPDAGAEKA